MRWTRARSLLASTARMALYTPPADASLSSSPKLICKRSSASRREGTPQLTCSPSRPSRARGPRPGRPVHPRHALPHRPARLVARAPVPRLVCRRPGRARHRPARGLHAVHGLPARRPRLLPRRLPQGARQPRRLRHLLQLRHLPQGRRPRDQPARRPRLLLGPPAAPGARRGHRHSLPARGEPGVL